MAIGGNGHCLNEIGGSFLQFFVFLVQLNVILIGNHLKRNFYWFLWKLSLFQVRIWSQNSEKNANGYFQKPRNFVDDFFQKLKHSPHRHKKLTERIFDQV